MSSSCRQAAEECDPQCPATCEPTIWTSWRSKWCLQKRLLERRKQLTISLRTEDNESFLVEEEQANIDSMRKRTQLAHLHF